MIYVLSQTPGIVSPTEFRTFWIKTGSEDGKFTVAVGKGGEAQAFMSQTWNYQKHSPIEYVAFYTTSGEFKFPPHDPINGADADYVYIKLEGTTVTTPATAPATGGGG